MKLRSILIKSICFVCLSALALAFAGCGKSKSSASVDDNPFAVSNPGKLTSKGYELPFEYPDDYKAIIEVRVRPEREGGFDRIASIRCRISSAPSAPFRVSDDMPSL